MKDFDLKHLLSSYNIKYKPDGNSLKVRCLNPAHSDKNPSLNISTLDPHLYHCFSCGFKGNKYSLVKHLSGKSWNDYNGIEDRPSYEFVSSLSRKSFPEKKTEFTEVTLDGNLDYVTSHPEAVPYILSRGINHAFLLKYNVSYTTYAEVNGTKYVKRLCIPLCMDGKVVNIEGRAIYKDIKPKVLYAKGTSTNFLFDYDNLNRNAPLYVVEGIMHLPNLFELGYRNITATFGSRITKNQMKQLKEFKKIILIPDNDEAGLKMIEDLEEALDDREFNIVFLPTDVNDVGEATLDQLKESLDNKISSVDYFVSGLFNKPLNW